MYFSDDGDVLALRFDNWKVVFMEQRVQGTLQIWAEPFVVLRVPKLFNLRTDPYERADITSNTYWDWVLDNAYLVLAGAAVMSEFLATSWTSRRDRRRRASRSTRRSRNSRPCSRQVAEKAPIESPGEQLRVAGTLRRRKTKAR